MAEWARLAPKLPRLASELLIEIMHFINSHRPVSQTDGLRSLRAMLVAGLFLQSLSACADRKQAYPEAGDPFPLEALDQITNLSEEGFESNGKVLLINFWATWCAPCRKEMPDLQRLSETLDRRRFDVIGVSVDEDINLVREFLLQRGIRFVNFQDPDLSISDRLLGIDVFPTTFIVDRDGNILHRISGEQIWNQATFEALLGYNDRAGTNPRLQLAFG